MTEGRRPASMVPGSLGYGLGQQTGGTWSDDAKEMDRLLKMVANVSLDAVGEHCGEWYRRFLCDWRVKWVFATDAKPLEVTGRQLFKMRDLKDLLIEKGML